MSETLAFAPIPELITDFAEQPELLLDPIGPEIADVDHSVTMLERFRSSKPSQWLAKAVIGLTIAGGATAVESFANVGTASAASSAVNKTRLAHACRNAAFSLQAQVFTVLGTPNTLNFASAEVAVDSAMPGMQKWNASCSTVGKRVVQVWHEKETFNRSGFKRDSKVFTQVGDGNLSNINTTTSVIGENTPEFPTYDGCLNDGQAPMERSITKTEWISNWRNNKIPQKNRKPWQISYWGKGSWQDTLANAKNSGCATNTADWGRLEVTIDTPIMVLK